MVSRVVGKLSIEYDVLIGLIDSDVDLSIEASTVEKIKRFLSQKAAV